MVKCFISFEQANFKGECTILLESQAKTIQIPSEGEHQISLKNESTLQLLFAIDDQDMIKEEIDLDELFRQGYQEQQVCLMDEYTILIKLFGQYQQRSISQFESKCSRCDYLPQLVETLQHQVQGLKEELRKMPVIKKLLENHDKLPANVQANEYIQQIKQAAKKKSRTLEMLDQEVQLLKRSLSENENSRSKLQRVIRNLQDSKQINLEQLIQLNQKLLQEGEKTREDLDQTFVQLQQLKIDKQELENKNRVLSTKIQGYEANKIINEQSLKELRQIQKQLNQSEAQRKVLNEEQSQSLQGFKQKVNTLQTQLQKADNKYKMLEENYTSLSQQYEAKCHESYQQNIELEKVSAKILELQTLLSIKQDETQQLNSLEKRYKNSEEVKERLSQTVKHLASHIEQESSNFKASLKKLSDQNKKLRHNNNEMVHEIRRLQYTNTDLRSQVYSLSEQIQSLQEQNIVDKDAISQAKSHQSLEDR